MSSLCVSNKALQYMAQYPEVARSLIGSSIQVVGPRSNLWKLAALLDRSKDLPVQAVQVKSIESEEDDEDE